MPFPRAGEAVAAVELIILPDRALNVDGELTMPPLPVLALCRDEDPAEEMDALRIECEGEAT